ncbi:hypothetical protein FHX42_002834 [Saccharopolyspora lacisalsi]|uniref:Uncharacterized protein n=1 Tax=Halosaccharopolyspora lacisalsi TaxID=1000566 RepID=A0A839DWS6_9PSEU|nr:hypothetical protein [Halosaccharopolyspora lacisalsi]
MGFTLYITHGGAGLFTGATDVSMRLPIMSGRSDLQKQ